MTFQWALDEMKYRISTFFENKTSDIVSYFYKHLIKINDKKEYQHILTSDQN